MKRLAIAFSFVIPLAAGCASTVESTHPVAADYARNEVPSAMQADVAVVISAKEDVASRRALSCILSFAYMAQEKDRRAPPMPDGDNPRSAQSHCDEAARSSDPAIAAIGRKYGERARAELTFDVRRAELDAKEVDNVVALLERGDANGAYRKLLRLHQASPPAALKARIDTIEAAHREPLATEATFEAQPSIQLLRARLAKLDDAVRRGDARGANARGANTNDATVERDRVQAVLNEEHAAFVDAARR